MAVEPVNDLSRHMPGMFVDTENEPVSLPDSTIEILDFNLDPSLNRFPTDPIDPYAAFNQLVEDEGR